MDFFIDWILFILFVSLLLFWWRKKRHPRFPPGPVGIPFLGVIPFLTREPWKIFKQWSLEKYGPIMSVRIANRDIIVLNNFEAVHQAFVKQNSQFSGRAYNAVMCRLGGRQGIGFKDYDSVYKTHKRFALKTLRGLGFGRKDMEDIINDELQDLITFLDSKCETETVNMKKWMCRSTANIVSNLCMSKRFEYEDNSYNCFLDSLQRLFSDEKDKDKTAILNLFDILRFVPPFSGAAKRYFERDQAVCDFIRETLTEHKKDFDPNHHRDFMDSYIHEQQTGTGSNHDSFTDDQLIFLLRDFYIGGAETVATSICWLIVILLNYPHHYKTMQEEIDAHLGSKQLSTSIMKDMPFTSALLCEVTRFRTLGVVALIHQTTEDSELSDYFISKETLVVGNIWGVHNDPDTWKNSEQFDPYRHIDENGKFIPSKKIIPFSTGPRSCPGESLARVELFFFAVKLFHTFTFEPDEKGVPSLEEMPAIIVSPYDFEVCLKKRN